MAGASPSQLSLVGADMSNGSASLEDQCQTFEEEQPPPGEQKYRHERSLLQGQKIAWFGDQALMRITSMAVPEARRREWCDVRAVLSPLQRYWDCG